MAKVDTVAANLDDAAAELEEAPPEGEVDTMKAKKKKKCGNKKNLAPGVNDLPELKTELRLLGTWPAEKNSRQTFPPTVPIHKCYNKGNFPHGEILPHPGANGTQRMTDKEKQELDRIKNVDYDAIRRAAEAHRQTRKYVQDFIKPGMSTLDIVQKLEAKSKELIGANGIEAGWAFPTGISFNNCAAHYTPNYGENPLILTYDDVVKIDFGLHVGGRLVDCAFTVAFNEKFDPLIKSTQDATNTGLREAGIDAKFSEVGAAIEEVIRSYEIELDGKTYPIKPIENLNGHTTDVYRVHGGKSLPIVATETNEIMEEGEVYAIETFASTGKGRVWEQGTCSHYMPDYETSLNPSLYRGRTPGAKKLLKCIQDNFSTLAFCRRWLDDLGQVRHLLSLKSLVDDGVVNTYPPLQDEVGCYTSQMEHTIILRGTCKEIVTRGIDY